MKKTVFLCFLLGSLLFYVSSVKALDISDCKDDASCRQVIDEFNQKLSQARTKKKTLADEIALADNQISLTNVKIAAGEVKIKNLTGQIEQKESQINSLENSLKRSSQVLQHRIEQTYIAGLTDPVWYLFSSSGLSDLISRLDKLKIAQKRDKVLMENMALSRRSYQDNRDWLDGSKKQQETVKQELENNKALLGRQKTNKQALLVITQNDEATYQQLVGQAEAQLAAFSSFVNSQGGASLLSNQTICDDWGCYYNQRDSQWGGVSLNGTGYTLANSGCLVSSMAMVYTHYGHKSVTPQTVDSNSFNFASYYPAYLKYDITADGATFTRQTVISYYNSGTIDQELKNGPLVVGIGYGPSHFVVLLSGSGGNYKMNDPYTENGHNLDFTSKYSLSSITEVDKILH